MHGGPHSLCPALLMASGHNMRLPPNQPPEVASMFAHTNEKVWVGEWASEWRKENMSCRDGMPSNFMRHHFPVFLQKTVWMLPTGHCVNEGVVLYGCNNTDVRIQWDKVKVFTSVIRSGPKCSQLFHCPYEGHNKYNILPVPWSILYRRQGK